VSVSLPKVSFAQVRRYTLTDAFNTIPELTVEVLSPEADLDMADHRVRVVRPAEGVPVQGGGVPSLAEVVQALQTLNDEQLSAVREVAVNPVPNPEDPEWQTKYENPKFRSAAASGGGVVTFYPGSAANPDDSERREGMRWKMQHEAGHAVSEKAWAADPSLKLAWMKRGGRTGGACRTTGRTT
jgi:hypothetical protein